MNIISEEVYAELHRLKGAGLNPNQASIRLDISSNTAAKYWAVSPEEYNILLQQKEEASRSGSDYRTAIINQLKAYPEKSAAQIYKTICNDLNVEELPKTSFSTFRNLVKEIRKEVNCTQENGHH